MQRSTRTTIKDIAKAAGVSPTTVSHSLSGKGAVGAKTVAHVRRVAESMNYRPSPVAQGLKRSHLGIIALIMRPLHSLETFLPEGVDYFSRLAGTAALSAMDHGYSMLLVDDPTRSDAPSSTLAADAFIVTEPFANDPVLTLLESQGLPFVTIGADPARRGQFIEIEEGADTECQIVLDHLLAAGATRIALVTGTDENDWNLETRAVMERWWEMHGQAPLTVSASEDSGVAAGDEIIEALFSSPDRPDAIYCMTGRHAAGLAEAALRRGIKVPADLLIIAGSDALQNRISKPGITALDLNPDLTAQLAVEIAVKLAEDEPVARNYPAVPPTLRVRESTTRN